METKICTKCGKELPIEDFYFKSKSKETRRAQCKYCHKQSTDERAEQKRQIILDIKSRLECKKCGESREYCLDFHHINPDEKEGKISRMMSSFCSVDKMLQEIEKCEVLCANCHREFHYLNSKDGISLEEYLNE